MQQRIRTTALAALLALGAVHQAAQAQFLDSSGVRAVPTYEAVGLYWSSPSGANSSSGCEVKFRPVGGSTWTQGLALWYDSSRGECRGSLVSLMPGTQYEAQLNLPGQAASKSITFTTWANAKPVAQTIKVASGFYSGLVRRRSHEDCFGLGRAQVKVFGRDPSGFRLVPGQDGAA